MIGFGSIGEGLPGGDPITPYVRLAVKLGIVYTLRSIPLEGPSTSCFSLHKSTKISIRGSCKTKLVVSAYKNTKISTRGSKVVALGYKSTKTNTHDETMLYSEILAI